MSADREGTDATLLLRPKYVGSLRSISRDRDIIGGSVSSGHKTVGQDLERVVMMAD
jgi:hypothetical protein